MFLAESRSRNPGLDFRLDLFWHGSGEAEVADLDGAILSDQDVCWLNVAVDDVCRVQEVYTAKNVVQYDGYMLLVESLLIRRSEDVLQVERHVLHDEEHIVEWLLTRDDDLEEFRREDVGRHLRQLPKNRYLAQNFLAGVRFFEHVPYQFDGDFLTGLYGRGFNDLAKTAGGDVPEVLVIAFDRPPDLG